MRPSPGAPWFLATLDHLAEHDRVEWVNPSEERVFIAFVAPAPAPDLTELEFVGIKALHRVNDLANDRDRFVVWQGFARAGGTRDTFYAQRWEDVDASSPSLETP